MAAVTLTACRGDTQERSEGMQQAQHDRTWIARLSLTNYRNYTSAGMVADRRPVVLSGQNGAGKTNLLEALSLLAPGRGLRGAAFAELARRGADGSWAVSAEIHAGAAGFTAGTGQRPGDPTARRGGRSVRIDGEAAGGSGALAERLQLIWLTPAMDGLFTGPAADRRRFLDRLILCFDPAYRRLVSHFERAMRQRNRLLELGERRPALFAALETQMAETGVAVAAARVEVVERLAALVAAKWPESADAPFPWATLALEGHLEQAVGRRPAVEIEDDYGRELAASRERDRAARRTLIGPHRSDLVVGHGPKAMPARFCSTGEQKALLVGLIIAHAEAVKGYNGDVAPLILLDEIAAHLDATRRAALFAEIDRLGAQAWMTGTDAAVFAPLRGTAQFLTITDGTITRAGAMG